MPPPRLSSMSRSARPMVVLARKPGPKQPAPPCSPILPAYGPFTIMSGATPCIVHCTPPMLNSSRMTCFTAPSTTGRYSGLQPAIRAWIATVRTVAGSIAGGIGPTSSSGSRRVPVNIHRTRSSVGVTTGKPSDHSFPRKNSNSSTLLNAGGSQGEIELAEIVDLLGLGQPGKQPLGLGAVAVRGELEEFLEQLCSRERIGRHALEAVAFGRDLLAVLQLQRDAAIERRVARRELEPLDPCALRERPDLRIAHARLEERARVHRVLVEREGHRERHAVLRHGDVLGLVDSVLAQRFLVRGDGDAGHVIARELVLFLEIECERHGDLRGGMACIPLDLRLHDVPGLAEI